MPCTGSSEAAQQQVSNRGGDGMVFGQELNALQVLSGDGS